jgi:carbamoyltransferase
VLNTSFNDNGEPIVESPEHAIKAFLNMDIDYLVIGNYIVNKKDIK